MFAVHARYRGRETRRAELVSRSAEALSTLRGMGTFTIVGVEDITAPAATAAAATDTTMALLSTGDWAVGIGVHPDSPADANANASACMGRRIRAGQVKCRITDGHGVTGLDVEAVFILLGHVLAKRTEEGRIATAYVRRGMTQSAAAKKLGISKQAMSQRLQAAGWAAEAAGWQLAVNLLERADGQ